MVLRFVLKLQQNYQKKKIKIYEIPISYNGRTYDDGKKITSIDAIVALKSLIKYRFIN